MKQQNEKYFFCHDDLVRNAAEDYDTPRCISQCIKCKNNFTETSMKHYYLKDNKIWMANKKMPLEKDYIYTDKLAWWQSSLQPCEIIESDLDKIEIWLNDNGYDGEWKELIEVTDIIHDNNGVITFKEKEHNFNVIIVDEPSPKQVDGEIEAVEFAEYIFDECDLSTGQFPHEYLGFWHKEAQKYFTLIELYEIFKNKK